MLNERERALFKEAVQGGSVKVARTPQSMHRDLKPCIYCGVLIDEEKGSQSARFCDKNPRHKHAAPHVVDWKK